MSEIYKKQNNYAKNQPGMINLEPNSEAHNTSSPKRRSPSFREPKPGKFKLTRRQLIYGVAGAGVLAAAGFGIKTTTDSISNNTSNLNVLDINRKDIIDSNNFQEIENNQYLTEKASYTMPYNTIAFANFSNIVVCLVPENSTETLVKVKAININTGKDEIVLEKAVNQNKGYDIFDIRANDNGIVWTEINILQNKWIVYGASYKFGYSIDPIKIDAGNKDWKIPSLAVSENNFFWQTTEKSENSKNVIGLIRKVKSNNPSAIQSEMTENLNNFEKLADIGNVIYTTNKNFGTPLYSCNDGVVICSRADTTTIYYQLKKLTDSGQEEDLLTLPQSMVPMSAGYGNNGFHFSLNAIYNNGTGVAGLGTYTPINKSHDSTYNTTKWLYFSRTPSAPPAWCGRYLIVRSTKAICALDLSTTSYSIIDRPNASDEYGEYLASEGQCTNIVTYADILDHPVSGEEVKECKLRIFELA